MTILLTTCFAGFGVGYLAGMAVAYWLARREFNRRLARARSCY
jgi:hypothetical protein